MQFLILGSNPVLSLAEICAVYGQDLDLSKASQEAVLFPNPIAPSAEILSRLAGVIKAGSVGDEPLKMDEPSLVAAIVDHLPAISRLTFGISIYAAGNETGAKRLAVRRQAIGIAVKKRLKSEPSDVLLRKGDDRPGKIRFVGSKTAALSSVAVQTNGLMKKDGAEICLFATKDGVLFGKTEAVQDFRSWSQRDFGRPGRDPRSGMLPPKLARLMVNLSGISVTPLRKDATTILDPFCGSGTILMEAALLGFRGVVGGDVSDKAIADTQKNVEWLETSYRGPQPGSWPKIELHLSKAEDLRKEVQQPIDTIVTEPYLGPPLRGRESMDQIKKTAQELQKLYRVSFLALASMLVHGGRAVVAVPVFQTKTGAIPVPVLDDFRNIGLKNLGALPKTVPSWVKTGLGPQSGLLYEREGQRIAREILVFEKM